MAKKYADQKQNANLKVILALGYDVIDKQQIRSNQNEYN